MKCRLQLFGRSERGIALVITLVMLAIVTVMAIVFLAVSRRERTSVKMAEEMATASSIAEAALERAKAQAIAQMNVEGSKLHYDMFNSTNYLRGSFDNSQRLTGPADPANVSYQDSGGNMLTGTDYLRMLANLQYDARPPVFIETNQSPNAPLDFRFYLDFNRNRFFESNGWVTVIGTNGVLTDANNNYVTNSMVGDPEWIGVLERSDRPHSETNRFIGRMAYLVVPAGKQLDINYLHNHVFGDDRIDLAAPSQRNGFARNQGVGPWEINLAAFFRELNPLTWVPASYRFRGTGNTLSGGAAFDDARAVLAFRYDGRRSHLKSADEVFSTENLFNPANGHRFREDFVDNYGDDFPISNGGPVFRPRASGLSENDNADQPWPGSTTTNAFTDIQQLYSLTSYGGLVSRLKARSDSPVTSDRYSFYRLMSQLGVDSTPALKGKLQLNYDNAIGEVTNTIQRWTNAVRFFTNAAELMLRASIDRTLARVENLPGGGRVTNVYYQIGDSLVRTNFSVNNIQIYRPGYEHDTVYRDGNEHNSTIHRILQLALNIYDSTTNRYSFARPSGELSSFPTVLRPIYTRTQTNIYISGWEEVPDGQASRIVALPFQNPRSFFTNSSSVDQSLTNIGFFGQHFIVGAKKGHPNFNELAVQNYVEVSRKLEVAKAGAGMVTNQMFLVSLFNRWGLEAWNSYTSSYPRNVQIAGQIRSRIAVHNLAITNGSSTLVYFTNTVSGGSWGTNNWPALGFQVPVNAVHPLINDVAYFTATGFTLTNQVRFGAIEPAPKFQVYTTNDVQFYIYDGNLGRFVDYVSFTDLVTVTDISTNLYSPQTARIVAGRSAFNEDMFWDPQPASGSPFMTVGIENQIAVSQGEIEVDDTTWRAYRFNSPDKRGGISKFRRFMGLGLRSTDDPNTPPSTNNAMQTPFVPTRRIHQLITWQANDPLVHYLATDLTRPTNSAKPINLPIAEPLPQWNIGRLNDMYHPWGGHPNVEPSKDPFAYNMALQDPGVRKSDDWEFPADDVRTNNYSYIFPNIGALGRVHRGTPWQTVYLKPIYQFGPTNEVVVMARPSLWQSWAGTLGGYPMNDWRLLDVFTTAVHENAARGLLSVNQTNQAAWSAVLSGVTVATNAVRDSDLTGLAFNEGLEPTNTFRAITIEPASPQIARIVHSINTAREFQPEMILNPNRAQRTTDAWVIGPKTNQLNGKQMTVFHSAGELLSAPALTVQSPFLNGSPLQIRHVWTDRAVEHIPQQILSLVQRDEPRFVVYAFGQSLKPAPRSLATHPDFYNICTNYQITGEVITKTTFRVEGELRNPANPLRTVVENYQILPPPE